MTVETTKAANMSATSTATGKLVDRFGSLKAAAADISESLDEIKTVLIEREGEAKLEGEIFRLTLGHSLRQTTDWKAVSLALAKKAGITDKAFDTLVAANTGCTDMWVARSSARITK
jgi:hypothetical protein